MDYVGGERQDWVRWWSPLGLDPVLDDGMLADPEGLLAKHSGQWKVEKLADLADVKCLVLLGEPGSGKSDEMVREQARLADLHVRTLFEDLGEHGDWSELKAAIFGDPEVPVDDGDETVLFLDAFDEATQSIDKVAASLARALRTRRTDGLKLRIACRPGVWSDSFGDEIGRALSCPVERRTVVPLSVNDISATAAQVGLDPHAFLREVRAKRIGPLAATPITLSLLLRLALEEGGLPDTREGVYEEGVALLADENNDRRRGEGKAGPPVDARLAAAEHLAALSLLSNRPVVIERKRVGSSKSALALDEAEGEGAPLEHLEAIWDSALLTAGTDGAQRWMHRSVAEYLAAERLSALPVDSLRRLLGDSSPRHHVIPQLAELALWLGTSNGEIFEWLANTDPKVLLVPNLGTWSHEAQRKLTLALLAHLAEKHPLGGFQRYRGLDYPELSSDLRPYLDSAQPAWLRREVIHMLIDAERRDLDSHLMSVIESCIAGRAADYYSTDEIGLATIACLALEGTADAKVLADARRLVLDAGVSVHVRSALIPVVTMASGWAGLLADLTADAVVGGRPPFSRDVARRLGEALAADDVSAAQVLGWLHARRTTELDADMSYLVGDALIALPEAAVVTPRIWGAIGTLCQEVDRAEEALFRRWPSREPARLPDDVRTRVALEMLRRSAGSFAATFFVTSAGLATAEDVRVWMEQLASAQERTDLLSIVAAEDMLRNICPPTPENIAAGREVLPAHPLLQGWFDDWSSVETQEAYRSAKESSRAWPAERPPDSVTTDDLAAALLEADWPRTAELLRLSPKGAEARRHSEGIVLSKSAAWRLLGPHQQEEALELAFAFVRSEESGADVQSLSDAYGVVATERPGGMNAHDAAMFAARIPFLFDVLNNHAHMAATLWAVRNHDVALIEDALEAGLVGDGSRQTPMYAARLGRIDSLRVTGALVGLCRQGDVDPWVLEAALPALLRRDGPHGRAVALAIVEARPTETSEPETDAEAVLERRRRRRAEIAAVALLASDQAAEALDHLLGAMSRDAAFRSGVISTATTWIHLALADLRNEDDHPSRVWAALPPDGLATVYLWARQTFGQHSREPGVMFSPNAEEELASQVHSLLSKQDSVEAQAALDRIAAATDNPYDKTAAADMRRRLRASTWTAPSPAEVAAILREPDRRVVASESDLAEAVLVVLDRLATEIEANPDLRILFWQRQADSNTYVPSTENEFSAQLAMLMEPRLPGVSLRREVQLHEARAGIPGARPDFEATVVDESEQIVVLGEVKGDWHTGAVSALKGQLVKQYLVTGRSRTGIYLGAWYNSDVTATGARRRARRRTIGRLRSELEAAAKEFDDPGSAVVYVRVIDLSFPHDEVDGAPASPP